MKKKITVDFIDKQKFQSVVYLGLTTEEICDFFMINSAHLWAWIKLAYNTKRPLVLLKKLRTDGKIDFLMKQRKLAEKNPAVSIFVGKNYYGQNDKEPEQEDKNDYEDLSPLIELLKGDENDGSNTNN